MQRNWIGRSRGAEIDFAVQGQEALKIKVFTTRPDTIFGATFLVLAPEHPLVAQLTTLILNQLSTNTATPLFKTEIERQENKTKPAFLPAITPSTLPPNNPSLSAADYVLLDYGEGAIMAVPAHDERDYEFATKFKLPFNK